MKKVAYKLIGMLLTVTLFLSSMVTYAVADEEEMDCPVYKTGDILENKSMPWFLIKIPAKSKARITPVNIPEKGVMSVILFDPLENFEDDIKIDIRIYSDSKCEKLLIEKTCSSFLGVFYETFTFNKPGKYYMQTLVSKNNGDMINKDIDLCFMPALIMTGDRDMEDGIWVYGATKNKNLAYYKLITNKTGYFTVKIDTSEVFADNTLEITLCDAKKKAITSKHVIDREDKELVFAVDKGTYYLKITTPELKDSREFADYRLKYSFVKLNDNGGGNFKDAKRIMTSEKEQIGLQTIQGKSSDWYRIELKNTSKMDIVIDKTLSEGDFTLELYDSKLKKLEINSDTVNTYNKKLTVYRIPSKLKKGSYYIKITKANKKTSGYYNLMYINK